MKWAGFQFKETCLIQWLMVQSSPPGKFIFLSREVVIMKSGVFVTLVYRHMAMYLFLDQQNLLTRLTGGALFHGHVLARICILAKIFRVWFRFPVVIFA